MLLSSTIPTIVLQPRTCTPAYVRYVYFICNGWICLNVIVHDNGTSLIIVTKYVKNRSVRMSSRKGIESKESRGSNRNGREDIEVRRKDVNSLLRSCIVENSQELPSVLPYFTSQRTSVFAACLFGRSLARWFSFSVRKMKAQSLFPFPMLEKRTRLLVTHLERRTTFPWLASQFALTTIAIGMFS